MQVRTWEDLTTKNPEQLKKAFEDLGLEVEAEATSYGSFRELVVRSKNGKVLRFSSAPTVSRLKTPTVEKYVVHGLVRGLRVEESFSDHDTAWKRQSALTDGLSSSDHSLEIVKRDVEVDQVS